MKDSGPWLAIGGIGAFAVAAVLAYRWSLRPGTKAKHRPCWAASWHARRSVLMIGGVFLGPTLAR